MVKYISNNNFFCRAEHKITVNGKDIPNPIQYFTDYDLPEFVMAEVRRQKYEAPTACQAQGIFFYVFEIYCVNLYIY